MDGDIVEWLVTGIVYVFNYIHVCNFSMIGSYTKNMVA